MHVTGFGLQGAIEFLFVERYPMKEGLSVVPYQAQGLFLGVFWYYGVLLEGDGINSVCPIVVWNTH